MDPEQLPSSLPQLDESFFAELLANAEPLLNTTSFSSLDKAIKESDYELFKTEFLKLTSINLEKIIEAINYVLMENTHSTEHGIVAWLVLTAISYLDDSLNAEQLCDCYNEKISQCSIIGTSLKLTLHDKFIIENKGTLRKVILAKILNLFNENESIISYHFFYYLYNDTVSLTVRERKGLSDLYYEAPPAAKNYNPYNTVMLRDSIKINKHPAEIGFELRNTAFLRKYYNHKKYYDWLLKIKKTNPEAVHINCDFDNFFASIGIFRSDEIRTETYYQQREKMKGVDGWKNYKDLMAVASRLKKHDEITKGIKQLAAFHHVTTEAAKSSILEQGLKPSQAVQNQQPGAIITTPLTSVTSTVFGSSFPGDIVIHRRDLSTLIKIPIEDSMRLKPNLTWTTPHEAGYALGREKINSVVFSGRNGNYTIMTILFLYNIEKREDEIHYHFYYRFKDVITHTFTTRKKRYVEKFNDCVYRGNLHDIITARFYIMLNRLKHEDDLSLESPYDCGFDNPEYALRIASHLVSRRTHELRYDATIPVDAGHVTTNIQHSLSNWLSSCRRSIADGDAHAFNDLRTNTPKPFLHANFPHNIDPFVSCFKAAITEIFKSALLPSYKKDESVLTSIVEKIVVEGFSSDGQGNAIAGTIPILLREGEENTPFLDSSLYMIIDILALPIFSIQLKKIILDYLEKNTFNFLLINWLELCCNEASTSIITQGEYPCINEALSDSQHITKESRASTAATSYFNDPAIKINGLVIENVFKLINLLEKKETPFFKNITHIRSLCHLLMAATEPSTMLAAKLYRIDDTTLEPKDLLIIILATLLKFKHSLDCLGEIFDKVPCNSTNRYKINYMVKFELEERLRILNAFKAKNIKETNPQALENINTYLLSELDKIHNSDSKSFFGQPDMLCWLIDSRDLDRLKIFLEKIIFFSEEKNWKVKIRDNYGRRTLRKNAQFNCLDNVLTHYTKDKSLVEDPKEFEDLILKIFHMHGKTSETGIFHASLENLIMKEIELKWPKNSYASIALKCAVIFEAQKKAPTCLAALHTLNKNSYTEGLKVLDAAYESYIFKKLITSLYASFDALIDDIISLPRDFSLKNINICFKHLSLIQEKIQIPIDKKDIQATLIQQIKTPTLIMEAIEPEVAPTTFALEYLIHLLHIVKSILSFPKHMAEPDFISQSPIILGDCHEKVKNITDPTLFTKLIAIAIPIAREHDPSITDNLVLSYLNSLDEHCEIKYDEARMVDTLDSILCDPKNSLSEDKKHEFEPIKRALLPDFSNDEAGLAREVSAIIMHLNGNSTIDTVLMLLNHYDASFTISNKQKMKLFSTLLFKALCDCEKDEMTGWQLGDTAKAIHAFLSTPKIAEIFRVTLATPDISSFELVTLLDKTLNHRKNTGEFLREFLNIFVKPFFPEQNLPDLFIFNGLQLVRDPRTLTCEQKNWGMTIYLFDDSHESIRVLNTSKDLHLFFLMNNVDAFCLELSKIEKKPRTTYEAISKIITDIISDPISDTQEMMLRKIPEAFKNNTLFFRKQHGLVKSIGSTPDKVQKKLFQYYYHYLPKNVPKGEKLINAEWYARQLNEVPDAIKQANPKKRNSTSKGSSAKKRRSSSSSAHPNGSSSAASSSAAAAAANSTNPNSLFSSASSAASAASSTAANMKTGK